MPGQTPRSEALKKVLSLPETGQLPAYRAVEAFTGVQQGNAAALFPEWQHSTRLVDDGLRKSFTRLIQANSLRVSRMIEFPDGAPVRAVLVERAGETGLALTVAMQDIEAIMPGDFFCLDAVEAHLQDQ